jgi:hypothetical protein
LKKLHLGSRHSIPCSLFYQGTNVGSCPLVINRETGDSSAVKLERM